VEDHRTDLSGGSCHTRARGEKIEKSEGTALKILDQSTRLSKPPTSLPFAPGSYRALNGTALVGKNRVMLASRRNNRTAFLTAAEEAGVAPQNTYFNQTLVGGSFGRRLSQMMCDSLWQSRKQSRPPVHVIWSREEAMSKAVTAT